MLARSHLLMIVAAGLLAAAQGCAHPYVYCGPDCGPLGPTASCGPCRAEGCADGACTAGCTHGCAREGRSLGLFSYLGYMNSCGGGCGEFYWNEWVNDPPKRCDPCDNWGNFVGYPACCPPKVGAAWRSAFGHRTGGGCGGCSTGGCAAGCCGGASSTISGHEFHGHESPGQGEWIEGEAIEEETIYYEPTSTARSGVSSTPSIAPRPVGSSVAPTTLRARR